MKHFKKVKPLLGGVVLSAALVVSSIAGASVFAHDRRDRDHRRSTPPSSSFSQGPQDSHPVEPGTVDAPETEKLGKAEEVQVDVNGKLEAESQRKLEQGAKIVEVSFDDPLNYCFKNLVYARVVNHTASTQSVQVTMYNQGGEHSKWATVAAGQTAYVAFYGVEGEYAAYLYHWDGSSYQYVNNVHGESICQVAVTRTYNSNGWVQLRIQNTGTAYATQKSSQLAPNAGVGEYTGTHHDKPVAGGEAIYRWFDVSGGTYGITSSTYGSTNSPYLFNGNR
jgi:hypothetical protein